MFPDIKSISLPCMLLIPFTISFTVSMASSMSFITIITWIQYIHPLTDIKYSIIAKICQHKFTNLSFYLSWQSFLAYNGS